MGAETNKQSILEGVVEHIDFTFGSAGNQWTTIDGVRYATWWDLRQGIREGVRVRYRPYKDKLFHNMADTVLCAHVQKIARKAALAKAESRP